MSVAPFSRQESAALAAGTGLLLIALGAMLHSQLGSAGDTLIDLGRSLRGIAGK